MKIKNGDAYLGDCLEIMDNLIEQGIQVDAIITDPPYGTTACKRDQVIPFDKMRDRLNKLIKPNGAIVLFGSEPFSSALRMSNIKNYKYDWIWKKSRPTGFSHSKNMPLKNYENISIFSNGIIQHKNLTSNRMEYYPQGTKKCSKPVKRTSKGFEGSMERASQSNSYIATVENFPRMILKFANEGKPSHPTQKPVSLIEYLIKTYTQEGELVLDFTAGSFTTSVACENTNRKRICIEKDEGYYNIGIKRVNGDTN